MNLMSIASKLTAIALIATLVVPLAQFAQADTSEPARPALSFISSTIDAARAADVRATRDAGSEQAR